jgi:hypothetical protein
MTRFPAGIALGTSPRDGKPACRPDSKAAVKAGVLVSYFANSTQRVSRTTVTRI